MWFFFRVPLSRLLKVSQLEESTYGGRSLKRQALISDR